MSTNHTPVPWYPVQYANQWNIQTTDYYDAEALDLLDEEQVGPEQAHANAHIMAAGADLLTALYALKNWVGKLPDWPGQDPPCEIVDKAIAKAEGKIKNVPGTDTRQNHVK